jgi:hypothetical protein
MHFTFSRMKAILAAFLAVALTSTTFAKKSTVDFTPFEGTYSGNYFLTTGGSTSYFATIKFKVSVPKSGKSMTVTPSGILFAESSAYPFGGSLTFGPGKKVQLLSFVFLPSALPSFGTGSFSGKKNSFSFTTLSSFSGSSTPIFTAGKLTFTKNGLTLTLSSPVFSSTYAVTVTAKKKK